MDRFQVTIDIARRVKLAMSEAGLGVHSIARAADITPVEMRDRLVGRSEFGLDELVRVGGFLRVPVSNFLGGAA